MTEQLCQEYKRVCLTVAPGEKNPELVVWFRGTREMIHFFRDKRREIGLDSSAG